MKRSVRYSFGVLRFVLGAGLLWYVLWSADSWGNVGQLFTHPWVLLGLASLPFLGAAIEAIRLQLLFKSQGIDLGFGRGYRLVAIGAFFNLAIPGGTGGDVAKLYYLGSDNRGKGVEVATVLLVDRVVALCTLLILIVALALVEGNLIWDYGVIRWLVAAAAILIVVIGVAAIVSGSERTRNNRVYRYIISKMLLHAFVERVFDALFKFRNHLHAIVAAMLASLVGHLALMGMFMIAGTVLVPEGSPLIVAVLSLLGLLANALPITPGGLGVGEAAAEQLFSLVGLSAGATLILAWRIGTFPVCVFGCISYIANVK